MVKNNLLQSKETCEILQNSSGDILIVIDCRDGGPENPRFMYDGGEKAVFYRSHENAIMLTSIAKEARTPLKLVDEVLLVEVDNNEVVREYNVPMRVVKSLEALALAAKVSLA